VTVDEFIHRWKERRGGAKRIEQPVVQALTTLVRYAELAAYADGTCAARRAA
jgi:hypothetical protein